MRNLKRALSLALASVMVMGLMVVGTGASYADVSSEDNKEAIEVLETVGIMTGDENGNFNPDALVTRNEMAVVMSNLMDYRVASYAGTSPFTDVPAWAEPYVAACYTNGITSGISATTYGGSDSVTTAQAALMLMKALGYFQYQDDFGDDWQLATTRQGAKIELFEDVDAGVREAMTRNDLAQLVLNTLKSGMVEPDDNTINVTAPGVQVQAGKVNYYFVTSTKDYAKAISSAESASSLNGIYGPIVELGEKLYNGDLKQKENETDAFGRPGTKWSYKSTSIGTFADTPIATYTAKASRAALYDLVGSSVVDDLTLKASALAANDEDKLVVYVDGVQDTATPKSNYFGRNSSAGGVSGKGVTTEVYLDNDGNVTLVYINTYLMQATNDYSEKKGTVNVTVKTNPAGLGAVNVLDEDDFEEIKDFAEDDYILYTASNKGGSWDVKSVAKAEVVTGAVEAYSVGSSGYVKIDGTQYDYAKKAATDASNGYATEYVVTDTASVVVDANGYALYVDDASISVGNYVFIKNVADSSTLATKLIADATFTDGVKDEITVKELYLRNPDGTLKTTPETITGNGNTILGGWYAYTKNSKDEYTLKLAETTQYDTGVSIQNGKATITGVGTANTDTIFLVKQTDGSKTLTVYTGITNVPDITGGTAWSMNSKDESGKKLSLVYVEAAKTNIDNASTDSLLYLLKHDSTYVDTADAEKVYVWKVLLNGEETKIETKESDWARGTLFVDYSIDSDGYYEKGTVFSQANSTTDVYKYDYIQGSDQISLSGDTLTIGGEEYLVDDESVIDLVLDPKVNADVYAGYLADEIMTDDSANYEVSLKISARALAGLFEDYNLRGHVYSVMVDDLQDTDLVETMIICIDGVEYSPAP